MTTRTTLALSTIELRLSKTFSLQCRSKFPSSPRRPFPQKLPTKRSSRSFSRFPAYEFRESERDLAGRGRRSGLRSAVGGASRMDRRRFADAAGQSSEGEPSLDRGAKSAGAYSVL